MVPLICDFSQRKHGSYVEVFVTSRFPRAMEENFVLGFKEIQTLMVTIFLRCLVQLQYLWVISCLKSSSFANLVKNILRVNVKVL